ncbi:hypothetical protein [Nocardioides sp.]|uniref:hypothetical protein n=1 Tax=Nocardioides sp. TaxID=35761 RepID=UPI003564E977
MGRQRPRSVTWVVGALWGIVALSGLNALLTVVLHEDLVRSWESGHPSITETVQPPAFVPVAIVLFLTFAALIWVLIAFLLTGHNWARLSLGVLVVFVALGSLSGLRTDLPVAFEVLLWVSLVLDVVVLVLLWHRDTSAYLRGVEPAARPTA